MVHLNNINDNSPVFSSYSYSVLVTENSAPGTRIVKVTVRSLRFLNLYFKKCNHVYIKFYCHPYFFFIWGNVHVEIEGCRLPVTIYHDFVVVLVVFCFCFCFFSSPNGTYTLNRLRSHPTLDLFVIGLILQLNCIQDT